MKSIHRIALGAVLTAGSAAFFLACQSDDSSPAQPGNDAAATQDVTTMNTDTGSESDAGTAETGSPADGEVSPETSTGTDAGAVSCTTYCAAVMGICTGSYKQYLDNTECMTACALLPPGMPGDTSGNTVGCRTTHAGYAATMGLNPHCWHAGPFGYQGCGTECESFCMLATSYCSVDGGFDAGAPPYASQNDCTAACAGFPKIDDADGGGAVGIDGGYNAAGPMGGNTLDCREWHLDNALDGPGMALGQELHCPHVAADSGTCN